MTTQSLNQSMSQFMARVEMALIIIFLIFSEVINLPTQQLEAVRLLTYVFILGMTLRLWKKMAFVVTQDLSLTLLIFFTLISLFWSADMSHTLRMELALLRTTLFGIYLATCFSFKNHLRILAWMSMWVIAINVFVCVAFPSFGIGPDPNEPGVIAFVGIHLFKQYLGRMMALATITLIIYFFIQPRHRWLTLTCISAAAVLLLLSQSRTYQVGLGIAILMSPIYHVAKQGFKIRTILLITILLTSILFATVLIANWETIVVDILGKNLTLNGRTPVWSLALEQLMKHPLLGYGYSAFWSSNEGLLVFQSSWASKLVDVDVKSWHAHNAFLDLTLQLGLIGLTLLLTNIVVVLHRAFTLISLTRTLEGFWLLAFLVIQLVACVSEIPTHLSPFSIYWTLYVALGYSSAIELKRHLQQRQPTLAMSQPSHQGGEKCANIIL
jgi:exopolysaccharide production protein ExoQ